MRREIHGGSYDLSYFLPVFALLSLSLSRVQMFRSAKGSLSLAAMVTQQLGSSQAFLKDKATTISSWGADHLSIRQLIYAALDGQTSWVIGANQASIPNPFHVSDLPRSWLQRACEWKTVGRSHSAQIKQEQNSNKRIETSVQADIQLLDSANRYFASFVHGEEPFNPFVHELLTCGFPSSPAAQQSIPSANLSEGHEKLYHTPDLTIDPTSVNWCYHSSVEKNFDFTYSEEPWWTRLDASQRAALDQSEKTRVTGVVGFPGSGVTILAAAEAVRSLTRSTSILLDQVSPAVRAAALHQRVLCVCPSDASARLLAAAISEVLPPLKLILFVSHEFADSWHPSQFHSLRSSGYVDNFPHAEGSSRSASVEESDRDVMVCSADFALTTQFPLRLRHRQTVIVDEANQLWLLKAMLLLRKLPHTERLLLFGNDRQLGANLGRHSVENVLAAAYTAKLATGMSVNSSSELQSAHTIPFPFRSPGLSMLSGQYRLKPHLATMVSEFFYDGCMRIESADRSRVVGWVDVQGSPQRHPIDGQLGWVNQVEINVVTHLWNHYAVRPGFTLEHIAIVCMFPAQRLEIIEQQPEMKARCFTVEDFAGQQVSVVLLTLSAAGITPSLEDIRRVNVACSRASSKLYIIGDRSSLLSSANNTIWHLIDSYESLDLEQVFPELAVSLERSFPELKPSTSAGSSPPKLIKQTAAPSLAQLQQEQILQSAGESATSLWGRGALVSKPSVSPSPVAPKPVSVAVSSSPIIRPTPIKPAASASAPKPAAAAPKDLDSSLHSRLVLALTTVLSKRGSVYLADLSSSFHAVHKQHWSTYSDESIEEFVERLSAAGQGGSAAIFVLEINRSDRTNPLVMLSKEATPTAAAATDSLAGDVEEIQRKQKRAAEKKERLATERILALRAQEGQKERAAAQVKGRAEEARLAVIAKSNKDAEKKANALQMKAGAQLQAAKTKAAAVSDAAALAAKAAATAESFMPVSKRHAGHHPNALAALLAAEIAPAAPATCVTCAFCKSRMPLGAKLCTECAHDIEQNQNKLLESPIHEIEQEEFSHSSSSVAAAPAPVADYPLDMSADLYCSPSELVDLRKNKNTRKKLLWLCVAPLCHAANAVSETTCSLCGEDQPHHPRYSRPAEFLVISQSTFTFGGRQITYESDYCKLTYTAQRGYHLVAKQNVVAGTILLRDQVIVSEWSSEVDRAKEPFHLAKEIAQQLVVDPVLVDIAARKYPTLLELTHENTFPASHGLHSAQVAPHELWQLVLSTTEKPADTSELAWQHGLLDGFQSNWQDNPKSGHDWKYGRYRTARQASLLESNCWPNCATVTSAIGADVDTDRIILAVTAIEAGTVLSDVCPVFGMWEWMMRPKDRRTRTLEPESADDPRCKCPRCLGHHVETKVDRSTINSTQEQADRAAHTKIGGYQDGLLQDWHKGYEPRLSSACEDLYTVLVLSYHALLEQWRKFDQQAAVLRLVVTAAPLLATADSEESKSSAAASAIVSPRPSGSPVEISSLPALTERCCFSQSITFFDQAWSFLTEWPMGRSHWRIQSVRGMTFDIVKRACLWERMDLWIQTDTGDEADKEKGNAEIGCQEYRQGLTQFLQILTDAISANKLYYHSVDPIKSVTFQALESFHLLIENTGRICPARSASLLSSARDAAASAVSHSAPLSAARRKTKVEIQGHLTQHAETIDELKKVRLALQCEVAKMHRAAAAFTRDDNQPAMQQELNTISEQLVSLQAQADAAVTVERAAAAKFTATAAAAQACLNKREECRIPTLTFPGIGTLKGQQTFIRALIDYDPAFNILKELRWPKRDRFGETN